MIGIVEGAVFIVLLGKVVKNHFSSLGIKPIAPIASSGVVKNHGRRSTTLTGLGIKVDSYA